MINVGRIVNSSKLSQPFTVWRKTGSWVAGRFVQTEQPIPMSGVITAAGTKDIMQVPEGDKTSQLMVFHSTMPLHVTHDDIASTSQPSPFQSLGIIGVPYLVHPDLVLISRKGTSDEIEWHGERYRLLQIKDWSDFGYYKAYGTSMSGV